MSQDRAEWPRLLATAMLVAFLFHTAGCSAAGGSAAGSPGDPAGATVSRPPPVIGPIRSITDAAHISLPLDAYQMTVEEDLTLQRAEWQLAVRCMARFGVVYQPPRIYPGLSNTSHERRYGVLDLHKAAAWGYLGEDPTRLRAARDAQRRRQAESGAVDLLLTGSSDSRSRTLPPGAPPDGCLGEARRRLAGGRERIDENLIFDMAAEAAAGAEADSRVRAAFARWSACMARSGLDYATPWEPNDFPWPRSGNVSEQERTVATADVRCKRETDLVGVWNAVDAAYQRRLIHQHAGRLERLRNDRIHRLAQAATIAR